MPYILLIGSITVATDNQENFNTKSTPILDNTIMSKLTTELRVLLGLLVEGYQWYQKLPKDKCVNNDKGSEQCDSPILVNVSNLLPFEQHNTTNAVSDCDTLLVIINEENARLTLQSIKEENLLSCD